MLTILAPAKLNLTLEVLAKRQDGFHEIRSVIQTISLCDSLHFQLGQNMEFKSDTPNWAPEKSLVSKASSLIREASGCTRGVTIEINKRIPWLSGLGGDSSDAAAILRGLNKLWGLGLSLKKLLELAAQLSSDASFFLYGGTALAEGRGEIVTSLPSLPHMWVVLMMPPVPRRLGKTKQLYASLKASHYTGGQITDRLVTSLARGGEVTSSSLFNVFDEVALDNFAGLGKYREQFLKAGAQEVHLAGSGPALFTLLRDKNRAEKIYENLQKQGLESYLSDTLPAIEPVK
ncbi:4-diphosphocytidyl-2-C-methyl-D-erythritol kinase [subsurface metagenome]